MSVNFVADNMNLNDNIELLTKAKFPCNSTKLQLLVVLGMKFFCNLTSLKINILAKILAISTADNLILNLKVELWIKVKAVCNGTIFLLEFS